MSNKISVDPNKLDELSNELVFKLTDIDEESKQLHRSLASLILSAPPEYAHCFNSVGDPWNTGQALSDRLSEIEQDVRMTANKFAERDDMLGRLYNLHQKYGTMVAMGGLVSRQLAYYGLGVTQFAKNADNLYSFKHMNALTKFSDIVDASKYKRAAKGLVSITYLAKKYQDTPFSDLVHKKFAKYLPNDVVNYTNSSKKVAQSIVNGSMNSTIAKDFTKTAIKFGRTNVVSTLVVTGGMEIAGAGLKISENYSKYADNPEVLKRENAKAVGRAVNNTAAITGFSVGGAVLFGAAGSLVGPVGTVAGAAVGSFVGGLVGEGFAKLTAGFSEKVAMKLATPIQATLDFAKDGWDAAGKVAEGFNSAKDFANKQLKETFENPVEKVKDIGRGLSKAKDTANSLVDNAAGFLKGKLSF